jgi:hypothetical protein
MQSSSAYSLVIIPPPETWPAFVEIKRKHMNPKIRRPPFPHVTLLGKLDERHIDLIQRVVADSEPFDLEIAEFAVFENKKNCTLYLDPKEKGIKGVWKEQDGFSRSSSRQILLTVRECVPCIVRWGRVGWPRETLSRTLEWRFAPRQKRQTL